MIQKIIIVVLVIIAVVFLVRFSTPEDTWLCQKGEWVKHGNPSASQPTTFCSQSER